MRSESADGAMAFLLNMPRLSRTMAEGTVIEWLKREGEAMDRGALLVRIESDKAEVEVEAPRGGVLRRVLVAAGETVAVDAPLAVLGTADEDIQALLAEAGALAEPRSAGASPAVAPTASRPLAAASVTGIAGAEPPEGAGKRQPISPVARRVAIELGVDPARVAGTGPSGLVTERDVRLAAEVAAREREAAAENAEVIPLTGLRGRIAERLSLSRRTAADVTTVVDVEMSAVARRRAAEKASYTAYVVWAAAQALREHPRLNSWLVHNQILVRREIRIGVAVALEHGLIVPVIREADTKSVARIAAELDEFASRARTSGLSPEELTGSSFTVTNSGGFGSLMFTPIINPPEIAILGMGKVAPTPIVRDGAVVAGTVMYLCLSYDHRAVDGAPAVQFLQTVKQRLEGMEETASS